MLSRNAPVSVMGQPGSAKVWKPRNFGGSFDGCHFLGYLDGLRSFHVGDRWARILCMISCEEPPLMGFEFGQIQRAFLHGLGLS